MLYKHEPIEGDYGFVSFGGYLSYCYEYCPILMAQIKQREYRRLLMVDEIFIKIMFFVQPERTDVGYMSEDLKLHRQLTKRVTCVF